MLSNSSKGVFFCRLFQNRFTEDGKFERKIIADTSIPFDTLKYGENGILGLDNVSIKYGMGFISCNASFPISPKLLFEAEFDENSEIHKLFSITSTWDIEFGWAGNTPNKLSGMKMAKWKLVYDADKRVFTASYTFVPANGYVLGDIKILMLTDAVRQLRKMFNPKTPSTNKSMSLGQVIELLLNASRDYIGLNSLIENQSVKVGDETYPNATNQFQNIITDTERVASRPREDNGRVVISDWTPSKNSFSERIRVNVSMYDDLFNEFGSKYGLNPLMLKTIMSIESGGDYWAKSPRGAIGLMQIMPNTYGQYGYDENSIRVARNSLYVASEELKKSYNLFNGDEIKTVAAYNAGRTRVQDYNGIPPFAETVNYVEKYKYFYKKWVDITSVDSQTSTTVWVTKSSIPTVVRNSSGTISSIVPQRVFNSNVIKYATKEDIPKPEDIRLVVFSEKGDLNELNKIYNAFNNEGIYNSDVINKITSESNVDLNVLQFISQLLTDNGYMIIPRPGSVDLESGKILWMIMQSDFDNIGETIVESEFVGIGNGKTSTISNALPRYVRPNEYGRTRVGPIYGEMSGIIQMFGSGTNLENSKLFDLHSSENIVLSINASTEDGESTVQSFQAAQNISQNNIEGGNGNVDYMNSIFKIMSQQSKKISMETLGFQELNPGDNIYVKLGGGLFSGRYKVLEMEHKINQSFTTSITAFRTVEGITNGQKPQITDNDPPNQVKFGVVKTGLNEIVPDSRSGGWAPGL